MNPQSQVSQKQEQPPPAKRDLLTAQLLKTFETPGDAGREQEKAASSGSGCEQKGLFLSSLGGGRLDGGASTQPLAVALGLPVGSSGCEWLSRGGEEAAAEPGMAGARQLHKHLRSRKEVPARPSSGRTGLIPTQVRIWDFLE